MKTFNFIFSASLFFLSSCNFRQQIVTAQSLQNGNLNLPGPNGPIAPVEPGLPANQVATGLIDTNNRASVVVAAYKTWYQAAIPDMGFTGDVGNCIAGTTSLDFQQSVIHRINFYRAMVGVPSATLSANSDSHQKAAMMMSANGSLSHSPPSTWKCYSSEGAGGAGSSNLALGASGPSAIDLYITDSGSNNIYAGHRRWVLDAGQSSFSTGDVPGANSLGVSFGWGGSFPAGRTYTSWPSAGFFPQSLIPGSNRWSFTHRGTNQNSSVTMKNTRTGEIYPTVNETFTTSFGGPTLVWQPQNFYTFDATTIDTTLLITVSGLNVNPGEATEISYTVTVINPDR